ncbi:DUF3274 domain-containing protein [Burkholderia multivorans]|uniref:DUF3274 domain-containing protein n=1 Tax=Burkholderia multivorans TaxID=87883 RepID=UPI000D342B8A|nr:DUF3274 domain-containing protein [Burkholderia multivorans]MBR8018397.1 DUF3274 domain-containing protein [Burkholderia multivorans]MEB2510786.1 DUF3274 domain-containing protein [Burkholderia multivorans]MEB2520773.1 DUF3274 domain-containing protein [Burkholderia multivorans]MEB2573075.1 DUF3274 domain-containing protein [Burkholderia multivorans]MEB2594844.1 DUF3274 domain-containing protein [Burkholderia multivorans]
MAETNNDYRVHAQGAGVTISDRPNARNVQLPGDLPGIVIFIHGVNDPGAVYSVVEQGLCQGLNERLSRADLKAGSYGSAYRAAAKKPKNDRSINDTRILKDPDMYLYQRAEIPDTTKSFFIPFYWGLRADNRDIAKLNNPGIIESRVADDRGNLMTRGQYQDVNGNRLDAHFAKAGGFFANATNNIPQMYGRGFEPDWKTRRVMHNALAGNSVYAGKAPDRRYFVLAATRLANLIKTIRTIQPKELALAHGIDPQHETITVMGHSQGTIITLLAQAILKQQGQRCVDCIIMVDTPYSLYATEDDGNQTGHGKLKTLVDIVNEVTSKPHTVPDLADLLITAERSSGRTGANWSKTSGKRLDRTGKSWITFDERDNRGKVYLYFCPEDTVVGLKKVHGIGTFGVPDEVPADGAASKHGKTMPAMTTLASKRFFQRMWTRLERDHNFDGKYKKVLVGTAPARVPVREQFQRLSPGPDTDVITNIALQSSFKRNDIRFINGEELKPPCEPDLYGGEIKKGGQRPGHADVAGMMTPDDVTKNVALGNQYASFQWIDVDTTRNPFASTESYKAAFNKGKAIDDQSQNWRVAPNTSATSIIKNALLPIVPPQYLIQREQTPNEARLYMQQEPDAREPNNYHSGVLHSTENHRWVTAMDVAIGQAVTLDDPVWRELLILMADWKITSEKLTKIQKNVNHDRLDQKTKDFIQACSDYYMYGTFPDAHVSTTMPPLVTSELTPAGVAAQEQAQAEYYKQEAQKAQMMYGNKTLGEVFQGMPR